MGTTTTGTKLGMIIIYLTILNLITVGFLFELGGIFYLISMMLLGLTGGCVFWFIGLIS
jgi:hypothetical protein